MKMFDDFTTQIQSDEFATEYEEFQKLLAEEWEEPEDWKDNPNPII